MAKAAHEQKLTRAEVRAVADQLGDYIRGDDDKIGCIMSLVYALTYCNDEDERETLSIDIESALLPYSRACLNTFDNLANKQIDAAKRRVKANR
jgi:hypothetical protein